MLTAHRWDIIARYGPSHPDLPPAFFADFTKMALDESKHFTLLTARRVIGHSLAERSPPQAPFSAKDRAARGDGAGDRVDATIEARVVLEKVKVLEGRMKYQIDKLVRIADDVYLPTREFEQAKAAVQRLAGTTEGITVATVRDALGSSRKITLPLLEYLDAQKFTQRVGDARVLVQP